MITTKFVQNHFEQFVLHEMQKIKACGQNDVCRTQMKRTQLTQLLECEIKNDLFLETGLCTFQLN